MDGLLDRILDEYGLVVSGWSATWDPALATAFRRSPAGGYSTFWTLRDDPTDEATRLIQHKHAQALLVESADTFFTTLEEKVLSIEESRMPHPLSTSEAVASLKRFLVEERHRIRLHDLLDAEVRRQTQLLQQEAFVDESLFRRRMEQYESSMQTLLQLLAVGCFHGEEKHHSLWQSAIKQLSELYKPFQRSEALGKLQLYPACLAFFACGMAAIAGARYGTVRFLLREAKLDFSLNNSGDQRLTTSLYSSAVLGRLDGNPNLLSAAGSDQIFKALRDPLRNILPNDARYDGCFDRWEYLLSVVYFDLFRSKNLWAPRGRFMTHNNYITRGERHAVKLLARESQDRGIDWLPFRERLFEAPPYFEALSKAYADRFLPWIAL